MRTLFQQEPIPPRRTARERAAAVRGQSSGTYVNAASAVINVHGTGSEVPVRAPADERATRSQEMSPPTIRQLDYIRTLASQCGLAQEQIQSLCTQIPSKALAGVVINRIRAGMPAEQWLQ